MPRLAANLSMLYQELPFLDRFEAAARDGFKGVEFLFPYSFAPEEIAARLRGNGLQQVLFNAPPGGADAAGFERAWADGLRGTASLAGSEADFRTGVQWALRYADALQCPRVHCMAGIPIESASGPSATSATSSVYESNLRWAAQQAAAAGVDILIEPINTRDMPGFFLNRQDQAHAVVQAVGAPNLKVQFDLYHAQIMEGDIATKIRQTLPTGRVGHFQIAGVPERHEPNVGELNYPYLLAVIDEVAAACDWDGWVGCEYRPQRGAVPNGTTDGLGWRP